MSVYRAPKNRYGQILKQIAVEHDHYDQETLKQVVDAVASYAESLLLPTNKIGDLEGINYNAQDQSVSVPSAYHEVYQTLCNNGYATIALDAQYGGGGGTWLLHHIVAEMLASGNLALSTCPMLTSGAIEALIANASQELLDRYLPSLVSGKYAATMCLTEPQCGTDLGLITTCAEKNEDHYLITGQKIWITFGEHDLTDNIIHLVLAKTRDAPKGSKGVSMFVVPKFNPDGQRNGVKCIGLEHKMGQNGSPTATLAFDQAKGWLVGEQCSGMRMMFEMMNPARMGVGVQALGLSEAAFQQALSFARERRQSRSLDKQYREPEFDADLILVHPDVKRMLMHVESTTVAMRWMVGLCSVYMDQGKDNLASILIPVVKSYVTEQSVANVSMCMQIMGGLGYVRDGQCEQYYRDGRITMIYEGTNGIQALDLLGRKIAKDSGKGLRRLIKDLKSRPVKYGKRRVRARLFRYLLSANIYLLRHSNNVSHIQSAAPHYLNLLAIVVQYTLLAAYESDQEIVLFYEQYVVPEAKLNLARIKSGSKVLMTRNYLK
ncbi:acyl-CoA dehydrogenase family protein [Candidatus Comchoanobacter bicostacola]|uniref:Acyl-CoA dehydrogenase family protein n=1 Tax=Candidatus Comchoanobacter bicostacola TaxID=2919598 RepID=A0ABY5DMN4_9GAMM|nr:acyl-CoA dehydrogenase family protein [Candidatus Comchoanobacter bicostacola]UTC24850.1 acyl-CoA dehydrogenase family protein [Candidatus Comchoanobacter bicostacola]